MKKFYTVKETAKILGFSTNTIYKYLDDGSLKGKRLKGRGRFKIPFSEIAPYLPADVSAKTTERPLEVNQKPGGRVGPFGLLSRVLVGMGLVYVFWNFGLAFLNFTGSSFLSDTATAIWGYSGRTSLGFGNLVHTGTTKLAGLMPSKPLPEEEVVGVVPESQVLSEEAEPRVKKVVINDTPTGWLRVRDAPEGNEIGKVYPGESYLLLDKNEDWYLIEGEEGKSLPAGRQGWISSQFAELQPSE